jgi:hypothetical protein
LTAAALFPVGPSLFGTPADDRPVQFTGIWEVSNGKLAHNWVERSAYELSQQLKQPPN